LRPPPYLTLFPPRRSSDLGKIHPVILFTARECGISEIFQVGGSQAIAAMAIGTESIKKVHKIFGPGNQYVTAAKEKAQQFNTAIDRKSTRLNSSHVKISYA